MAVQRVAPATVTGTELITTFENNQIRQVDRNLAMIYPNKTPFLAISNQLVSGVEGKARIMEWGEQSDMPRCVTIEGTTAANGTPVAAGGTALFVTPANAVVPDEELYDSRSGEVFHILTNTSGALTVSTRGSYNAADVACIPLSLPIGTQLKILDSAKEENAAHSNAKTILPELLWNPFQTFERDVAQSTIARAIEYYLLRGGSLENHDALMAMDDFKLHMENACLFGSRLDGTGAGPTGGYMGKIGGLYEWAKRVNNVHDCGGAFTYPVFQDIMGEHARVANGGTYYAFCCTNIINIVQRWALDYSKAHFIEGEKNAFGLRFTKIVGTNWVVNFINHESFEEDNVLATQCLIVQGANNSRHYLRGLSPQTHKGIVSPTVTGLHGYIDQITGTMTLKVKIPEANCILTNIAS